MRRLPPIALLAFLTATSPAALATCTPGQSPFADVPDDAIYCGSALWLRNALVTTGCSNGSIYCPSDPVTRAQMALFMKRLARAATPDIVYANLPSAPADLDGNGFGTCLTSVYSVPAGGNARIIAHATDTVSLLTDGAADVTVAIQMSLNGGLFGNFGANAPRTVVPGNQWTVVPVIGGQTMTGGSGALLAPGSTAQFRLLVQRQGASVGEVTDSRCQLMVHLPPDAAF